MATSSIPPSPPAATPDLSALLARARQGDRQALEAVLVSVAPAVHRFGLRMCKNAHDAEDVLQDTLLNVANHLQEFEGRSSLSSWVFALTRSACSRKRRGLKNRPPVSDDQLSEEPDRSPGPDAHAESHELTNALSTALDSLNDDQREVIVLRDIEGLSAPEAAVSLGISVDALKSRLHRARAALRDALRPFLEPVVARGSGNCPDIVALWSNKLEGDLSQQDCSAMERHLEGCPSCGAACSALKKALFACQQASGEALPPEIQVRVQAALRDWTAEPVL